MEELTEFLERAMESTEEFYDEVTETAERNTRHPDFRLYSRSSTADYVADLARVEKLYVKYCDAYDAVLEQGATKARLKNLEKAHEAFANATQALDHGNAMFTAYLDEGVAEKAAAVCLLLSGLIEGQKKQIDDLLDDVEDTEKLLKKARKEVTGAKVQQGFNLAITAVSLCLPPLKGAQAVVAALTIAGTKLAADELLGPTGPTAASGSKTAVTDYIGIADEVGKVGNTLTTIVSTVDTYTTDEKEIAKAKKTVAALKKKLAATEKAHAALVRRMAGVDRDLLKLAVALEKSVKAASEARKRYKEHECRRLDLIDMAEAA